MAGLGRTLLACAVLLAAAVPARADLQLCNRTSYILDLALGLEEKGAAATRGWFRVDPGQCRTVIAGTVDAEALYVHARAPALYGPAPLPQAGHADLCVADGNFVIAGARACPKGGQRLVRFTAIKPSEGEQGLTASLAEEPDLSPEQARMAGIQRLLVLNGYDANPIDGIGGKKTEAALAQFLKDRKLPAETATAAAFIGVLADVVKQADGVGFSWCNETGYAVLAALGVEDKGSVVTRGWYRVEPGKCLRPEIAGAPRRLYSFAEAVDGDGQQVQRADRALAWGGQTTLCTRNVKFELADHKACADKGLTPTGFAMIDLAGRAGATVRFREP